MLRSIPSKLGGVVALALSIIILAPLIAKKRKNAKFSPAKKTKFWALISIILIQT
ncbi:hypothetical protein FCN23_09555 [Campylobacter jejuni]|nr:hypothetical protein FCN23_09555 [Campylobacter jejuni]